MRLLLCSGNSHNLMANVFNQDYAQHFNHLNLVKMQSQKEICVILQSVSNIFTTFRDKALNIARDSDPTAP